MFALYTFYISISGKIKAFEITKFGDINVRLSGLGMLQYVYNAVEERFRDRVREELTKIIIQQFPTAFQMAMTQVSLPKWDENFRKHVILQQFFS